MWGIIIIIFGFVKYSDKMARLCLLLLSLYLLCKKNYILKISDCELNLNGIFEKIW